MINLSRPELEVMFDQEKSLMLATDTSSISYTDQDVIKLFEDFSQIILKYKPKYLLSNDQLRTSVYDVELQNWIAEKMIQTCAEAGVERFVIVQPEEFVASLSTEQVAEEAIDLPFDFTFCATVEQAYTWLLS